MGIVYVDESTVGWKTYVESWINQPNIQDILGKNGILLLKDLFANYVDDLLEHKSETCRESVRITDFNAVQSLCGILECVLTLGMLTSLAPHNAYRICPSHRHRERIE